MAALFKLKALRSGFSLLSPPISFSLQNQFLCRYRGIATEISANQHNFTVNYLINSCGLSPKGAISASKWLKLQSPERADSVLSFLRSHGFSATQISKVVRSCPELLLTSCTEKTLLPKLEFFSFLGVSREDLARTVAGNPRLLERSLEKQFVPTYNFLRSVISEKKIVSVFKCSSRLFLEGHSRNVVPNIETLRELGMPHSCISMLLAHFPNCLLRKPQYFGKVVDEVKQMGFDMEKTTSVTAIKALCSKSIWNRSCEVYKRWGWSEDDVLSAFRRFPHCMTTSEKKITHVMEFLVNKMGCPAGVINKYPGIVILSLEKRIIPRCSVVKVLILKGLIKEIENVSLYSLLIPVEKYFLERFVSRYIDEVPQLLSVYQGKVKVEDV